MSKQTRKVLRTAATFYRRQPRATSEPRALAVQLSMNALALRARTIQRRRIVGNSGPEASDDPTSRLRGEVVAVGAKEYCDTKLRVSDVWLLRLDAGDHHRPSAA